jgi:hypothetical protein
MKILFDLLVTLIGFIALFILLVIGVQEAVEHFSAEPPKKPEFLDPATCVFYFPSVGMHLTCDSTFPDRQASI